MCTQQPTQQDSWIRKIAALEDGANVSAGSEKLSMRGMEVLHAKRLAFEKKQTVAVFFQGGLFGHMLWSDWLRVLKFGVADKEGYEFSAKVTASGRVSYGGAVIQRTGEDQ